MLLVTASSIASSPLSQNNTTNRILVLQIYLVNRPIEPFQEGLLACMSFFKSLSFSSLLIPYLRHELKSFVLDQDAHHKSCENDPPPA